MIISELDLTSDYELQQSSYQVYKEIVGVIQYYADSAQDSTVESTHQIRKKLKFFRAYVKLLKPFHDPLQVQSANILLRDYGREFSKLRDAHVRALLLKEFSMDERFLKVQDPIQRVLVKNEQITQDLESFVTDEKKCFSNLNEDLQNQEIIEHYFTLKLPQPDLILKRISESYDKSYEAFKAGISDHQPVLMHEWRKRLKDVQYQLELILHNLSGKMLHTTNNVQLLCDYLGRYNDLEMLIHWIETCNDIESENSLVHHLMQLKDELQSETSESGKLLYDLNPIEFENQLTI
ncbi:MAG: CHAD domain-containing protein [Balneolaceae bacterium]